MKTRCLEGSAHLKKMFKKVISYFTVVILLSLLPKAAVASHLAGGEITYVCLGSNQYQINLNLYWDCTGGFDPGPSQIINLVSTCGGSATLTVNQTNPGGTDISQMCPGVTSTCAGGTFPGMNMNTYSGVVTLSPACDTWTMSYSTCCRNTAIDNVSGANYYIEATLNSTTAPCNSSPYFTAQPIPYVCTGQPVNYSYGVVEPDGDSLYYSLIDALDAAGVSSTYYPGYSGTSPLPGTTINSSTGLLSFTPTAIGNYVFVILVQEYDASGNLVGTVMRDIQFVVQNCANTVPSPIGGTISGFGGSAVQTGPYGIEMCAGNCFNFTATYSDSDPTDSLTFISNILSALPGAVVNATGFNPLTLDISWCAPGSSSGQNLTFTMTIEDNYCPIPGQQTFAYSVNILDATTTNPDLTICGSQTAQLNAFGGSVFNWSVVSGSAMTPANFSCNPCANPVASPAVTTTYAVISNLSGTCDNVDTVTVYVVPDFTYTISQSSTNSCLMDPVQLSVNSLSPAGAYTFQWSPATYLNDATIANPTATFISPGTYTYTVTITSPSGCVQTSTLSIVAAPSFAPVISAYADTSFCAGGTVSLGVGFVGSSVPPTCGASTTGGCGGAAFTNVVGTGTTTNGTSSWPAPYGNYYTTVKQQYLYTAAELNAAGITGGKIDQLDFNVTAIAGITTYHNYAIRMGCTNLTTFSAAPTAFESGLISVFNAPTYNVVTGWNTHPFSTAFNWDGISNVIVEVCFNELTPSGGSSWTSNSSSTNTTTTYVSTIATLSDSQDQCASPTGFWVTALAHPNVKFHYCSVIPNPANYTYAWTPASGAIANANLQNTTGMPPGTMDYYVTVTDIAGGCFDVDTVHVDVINISTLTVTPAGPYCVNGSIDTLQVSVPLGTGAFTGTGITNGALGVFDPSVAGVGTHQIIYAVSGSCGTGADTIDVVVIPTPDATITPVGNQCVTGSAINLSGVTPGGSWSGTGITDTLLGTFNPAVAGVGSYIITYTLYAPCYSQDTAIVSVTSQLDASITHTGPYCAAFPSATLTAVDPGGTWSGAGITDAVNGIFDPGTAGPGTHVITYTISGLCGAVGYDTIVVMPSPTISFTSDVNQGCEPTLVNYSSTTNQPGGTYSWDLGDGHTSIVQNPSNLYTVNGSYAVTLIYTNPIGCVDTLVVNNYITIFSQPHAAYNASPQPTTILSPEVTFTDESTGLVDQWNWTVGNLVNTTQQNFSYTFADTGSYPVTLIVTNIHGCLDTVQGNVFIAPVVMFYAPNAFTPNSNANNDVFKVYGDGIDKSTFEMSIFNRWGQRIFKTNNYDEGWNGGVGNKGEPVEIDVYVWKVTFKDFAGMPREYIGHVTLIK